MATLYATRRPPGALFRALRDYGTVKITILLHEILLLYILLSGASPYRHGTSPFPLSLFDVSLSRNYLEVSVWQRVQGLLHSHFRHPVLYLFRGTTLLCRHNSRTAQAPIVLNKASHSRSFTLRFAFPALKASFIAATAGKQPWISIRVVFTFYSSALQDGSTLTIACQTTVLYLKNTFFQGSELQFNTLWQVNPTTVILSRWVHMY